MLFIKQYPLNLILVIHNHLQKLVKTLLSDLDMCSIFSSEIPLDFHNLIRVVPLKYLLYLLAAINTK